MLSLASAHSPNYGFRFPLRSTGLNGVNRCRESVIQNVDMTLSEFAADKEREPLLSQPKHVTGYLLKITLFRVVIEGGRGVVETFKNATGEYRIVNGFSVNDIINIPGTPHGSHNR
jgi:hypothetical protein